MISVQGREMRKMFEARLVPMREAADELGRMPDKILAGADDLMRAERSLRGQAGMEEICRRVKNAEKQLEEKADLLIKMAWTLENICRLYQESEGRIGLWCEDGVSARKRETFSEYELDWAFDLLQL